MQCEGANQVAKWKAIGGRCLVPNTLYVLTPLTWESFPAYSQFDTGYSDSNCRVKYGAQHAVRALWNCRKATAEENLRFDRTLHTQKLFLFCNAHTHAHLYFFSPMCYVVGTFQSVPNRNSRISRHIAAGVPTRMMSTEEPPQDIVEKIFKWVYLKHAFLFFSSY